MTGNEGYKQLSDGPNVYRCDKSSVHIICDNGEYVSMLWEDMMFVTQMGGKYGDWIATILQEKATPKKVTAIVEFMRAVNERKIPEAIELGIVG